jgi:peroxiredoxin
VSQTLLPPEKPEAPATPSNPPGETKKPKIVIPVWAKVALMFAIVFMASIGYFKDQYTQAPAEVNDSLSDNQAIEKRASAPDTEFITKMGNPIKLSSLKGKVVLISFWAHWCAPCLVELPSFKVLFETLGNQDFAVVPVNLDTGDDAAEFIKNFWQDKSLPFETYFDPEKKAAKAFKVETLPANFVLDRGGRLVMASFGSNDWSNDSTIELIESLLNERQ